MKWAYKIQQGYSDIAIKSHNQYGKLVKAAESVDGNYGLTTNLVAYRAVTNYGLLSDLADYLAADKLKERHDENYAFASIGKKIDDWKKEVDLCAYKTKQKLIKHFPNLIIDMENFKENVGMIMRDSKNKPELRHVAKLHLVADETYLELDKNLESLRKFRNENVISR